MLEPLSSAIPDFVLLPSPRSSTFFLEASFDPCSQWCTSSCQQPSRGGYAGNLVQTEDNSLSSRSIISSKAHTRISTTSSSIHRGGRRRRSRNGLVPPPGASIVAQLPVSQSGKTLSKLCLEPLTSPRRRCNFTFDSLAAAAPASSLSSRAVVVILREARGRNEVRAAR